VHTDQREHTAKHYIATGVYVVWLLQYKLESGIARDSVAACGGSSLPAGDIPDACHGVAERDIMYVWRLGIARKVSYMVENEDALGLLPKEALWGLYDVCDL
jgi:hypothetical protein